MIIGIVVLVLVFTGFLMWIFWKYDFVVAFVITIYALVAELVAGGIALGSLGGSYSCSQVAKKMEVEYDYSFFTGCFIRDENGRWYNYRQQRVVK